jgi:hypothetical protein
MCVIVSLKPYTSKMKNVFNLVSYILFKHGGNLFVEFGIVERKYLSKMKYVEELYISCRFQKMK